MVGNEDVAAVSLDLFETFDFDLDAAYGQQCTSPRAFHGILLAAIAVKERNHKTGRAVHDGRQHNQRVRDEKRAQHSFYCTRRARASPTTNSDPVMNTASEGPASRSKAIACATECVIVAPGAGILSGGKARELSGMVKITRSAKGNSIAVTSATALSRITPYTIQIR